MKVLFLDIDGVLNHEHHYEKIFEKSKSGNIIDYPYRDFDSIAIKRLNNIILKTNCKIVVSSSWKLDSNLQEIFDQVGINSKIYGITPNLRWKSNDWRIRGKEIAQYLNEHPEIDNYAIVDDQDDMEKDQLDHFVQTSELDGLNDKCMNLLISILNKE